VLILPLGLWDGFSNPSLTRTDWKIRPASTL